MRCTLRLLLCAVLAIFVPHSAAAADPSPPPNYQGLWWNAPPGSESGWGLGVAHQGTAIIATWFTYDAGGNGLWLLLVANRTAEATFTGEVIQASGPGFGAALVNPGWVTRQPVGIATLSFRDPDNGTFVYAVKGFQGAKLITRQVFGPVPTCCFEAAPEFRGAKNYTDLWGAAGGGEPGWGIDLTHQGDILFAAWFAYDYGGAPRWLVATAPRVAADVYSGKLIRTTGPAFGAEPFDPARIACSQAGTATFTFAHGNAATFAYTLDGVTRTRAITRRLLAPPAGTRCRETLAATITGKVFVGAPVQALVCADANGNARCDPGEAQAGTDSAGTYELAAPAGYLGALVAEVDAGTWRMSSPAREYSANITPFTTLVQLTRERDFRMAELRVRNELGLPPRFPVNLEAPPAQGSLARSVALSIAAALESTATTVDHASPDALARVIDAFPPALKEMPRLHIATKNGVSIDSKEVYVEATYTLTNPAAATPTMVLNGKIRGRGNITWTLPKKPYKVQFANDAAYAAVPDFLGMRKNRNWALLADYLDRTLMRNQLMFTLGNSSLFSDGLKWTPSGVHVEVWLNGGYQGVYLLTEDIRLDAARLNIRKMGSKDVDGGYIVEVDFPLDCYNDGTLNLQHVTPQGVHVCIKTPDEESITPAQLAYIKALVDAAERDLYHGARIEAINPVSFADWYLLQELYRNYDATFYSSDYLWKDTAAAAVPADRLLNMGPLWDFDIGAGNLAADDAWRTQGCWVTRSREGMPNWFTRAFDNRDLLDLTLARWKDRRAALEKLVDTSIAAFARRLEAAQQRNFARWPNLDDATDYYHLRTYRDHVDFLRTYLVYRMAWLDQAYFDAESFGLMCK